MQNSHPSFWGKDLTLFLCAPFFSLYVVDCARGLRDGAAKKKFHFKYHRGEQSFVGLSFVRQVQHLVSDPLEYALLERKKAGTQGAGRNRKRKKMCPW